MPKNLGPSVPEDTRNCGNCKHWKPWPKYPSLGTCGLAQEGEGYGPSKERPFIASSDGEVQTHKSFGCNLHEPEDRCLECPCGALCANDVCKCRCHQPKNKE